MRSCCTDKPESVNLITILWQKGILFWYTQLRTPGDTRYSIISISFRNSTAAYSFFSDKVDSKQQQAKDLTIFILVLFLKLALCNSNKDCNFPAATSIRSQLKWNKHWRKLSNSEKFKKFILVFFFIIYYEMNSNLRVESKKKKRKKNPTGIDLKT